MRTNFVVPTNHVMRTDLVIRTICTSLVVVMALAVWAQEQAPTQPFTLKPVGRDVWAAIDLNGHAGSNAGFVIGDDGVLVVDSFEYPQAAEALLGEIRKKTNLPIKF